MSITPSKLVGERITLDFWFTDEMEFGEEITAHSIQVQMRVGIDPDPSHIVYGAGEHEGADSQAVTHQFHLGIPGCIYQIACIADTSAGRRLARQRRLAILPSPLLVPGFIGEIYTTHLYPIEVREEIENVLVNLSGTLRVMPFPLEEIKHTLVHMIGELYGSIKTYVCPPEEIEHAVAMSGTLVVALLQIELPPEEIEHSITNFVGTLEVKLIVHYQPPEEIQHAIVHLTGTLT